MASWGCCSWPVRARKIAWVDSLIVTRSPSSGPTFTGTCSLTQERFATGYLIDEHGPAGVAH